MAGRAAAEAAAGAGLEGELEKLLVGDGGVDERDDPAPDLGCALVAGAERQFVGDAQLRRVFGGHQLGAELTEEPDRAADNRRGHDDDEPAQAQRGAQQPPVAALHRHKRLLAPAHEARAKAVRREFGRRLEQARGQHRREVERAEERRRERRHHQAAELLHHDARHALHEDEWHEHDHGRQRGGDNRQAHFVGAEHRGLAPAHAARHVRDDVLQHHNGVVHHHADCNRQRRHRHDVDCPAHQEHEDERDDERERDGQYDDERRAQAAQEHQRRQHHEEPAVQHRSRDGADRALDHVGAVADDAHLVVGRKRRLDFMDAGDDAPADVHGVLAGALLDNHDARPLAVGFGDVLALLEAVLHARHVAEAHDGVSVALDHDLGCLLGRPVLGRHAHRVARRADFERAGGQRLVVARDGRGDLGQRKPVGGKPVGVDEDVDLPLQTAERLA